MLRATTPCTFSSSQLPKLLRTPQFLNTFYFQMCFAPQRSALFQHLNFQKWSDAEVFCTFSLRNQLRATPQRRATFPLSSPQMSPRPPLWRAYFSTLRSHKTTKKHSVSRLSYLFAHLHLLSSDLFSCDSSPC